MTEKGLMGSAFQAETINEKGSWVKIPRGPAAVREECCQMPLGEFSGRLTDTLKLKPEDLPVSNHHELYGR